jgi:hypothetical protein
MYFLLRRVSASGLCDYANQTQSPRNGRLCLEKSSPRLEEVAVKEVGYKSNACPMLGLTGKECFSTKQKLW